MKCFRLRCYVNNSFLVFHQGTKHSKTIKHSRFALVFHTVFSCLDPLMKHSNSLFTYNILNPENSTINRQSTLRNSRSTVNCAVINARSLTSMHKANDEVFSNMNCTHNFLIAENTDIAFITETWLTKSILDSEILPSNEFNIFRKDRETPRGGGVLLAVRSSLFSSIQQIDIPTDIEFVCCEVTTKNDKFLLASCYRPPNSNISWCRKFGETLQYLRDVYDQIVIAGDFNLPSIDWNCLENTTGSDELEFTKIQKF